MSDEMEIEFVADVTFCCTIRGTVEIDDGDLIAEVDEIDLGGTPADVIGKLEHSLLRKEMARLARQQMLIERDGSEER